MIAFSGQSKDRITVHPDVDDLLLEDGRPRYLVVSSTKDDQFMVHCLQCREGLAYPRDVDIAKGLVQHLDECPLDAPPALSETKGVARRWHHAVFDDQVWL